MVLWAAQNSKLFLSSLALCAPELFLFASALRSQRKNIVSRAVKPLLLQQFETVSSHAKNPNIYMLLQLLDVIHKTVTNFIA